METFALDLNRHPYSLRVADFGRMRAAKGSAGPRGKRRVCGAWRQVILGASPMEWLGAGEVVGGSVCVRFRGGRARVSRVLRRSLALHALYREARDLHENVLPIWGWRACDRRILLTEI